NSKSRFFSGSRRGCGGGLRCSCRSPVSVLRDSLARQDDRLVSGRRPELVATASSLGLCWPGKTRVAVALPAAAPAAPSAAGALFASSRLTRSSGTCDDWLSLEFCRRFRRPPRTL